MLYILCVHLIPSVSSLSLLPFSPSLPVVSAPKNWAKGKLLGSGAFGQVGTFKTLLLFLFPMHSSIHMDVYNHVYIRMLLYNTCCIFICIITHVYTCMYMYIHLHVHVCVHACTCMHTIGIYMYMCLYFLDTGMPPKLGTDA